MNIKKAVPGLRRADNLRRQRTPGHGLHITVGGVGRADVMVNPSAVADIER